jgi:hypothetical protein
MIPEHIAELQDAISYLHKAHPRHVESLPVKAEFEGKTAWDGVVEVFDLFGHPATSRVYAWSQDTDDPEHPRKHVTVLNIPPAISPRTAVQIAIVQEHKNARRNA